MEHEILTKSEVEHILNVVKNIGDDGKYLEINNLSVYKIAFIHKSCCNWWRVTVHWQHY